MRMIVVLNNPPRGKRILAWGKAMRAKMDGNNYVTSWAAPPAQIDAHLAALEAVEKTSGPGTAKAKETARQTVINDFDANRGSVQIVVDTKATVVEAEAIAESAGMSIRANGQHPKLALGAIAGSAPGSATLIAPVNAKRDPHDWRYSTDQKTFVALGGSKKAKMPVTGLPAGVPVYIQHRYLTSAGYSEWSEPLLFVAKAS
jgi:hypothetical protein